MSSSCLFFPFKSSCFCLSRVFCFSNVFATKRVAVEREMSLLGQENTLSLCFLLSSSFPFSEFLFLSFQIFLSPRELWSLCLCLFLPFQSFCFCLSRVIFAFAKFLICLFQIFSQIFLLPRELLWRGRAPCLDRRTLQGGVGGLSYN